MKKCNIPIREAVEKNNMFMYQVPPLLGISESLFTKKMRTEWSEEEQNRVIQLIEEYAKHKKDENGLINLYIRDKENGEIYRIGDNPHDQLTIGEDGQLHYYNLQNGDGCRTGNDMGGYEFVPNEDMYGYNCDPREVNDED